MHQSPYQERKRIHMAHDARSISTDSSSVAKAAAFERRIDARFLVSIIATGLMSFSGVLVETAMNVTFPTLMAEFGIGTSTVQWITTGYLLMLAIIIPASSYLKRRFRTRTLFVAAMALFLAGTALAALAPSFWFLLAGRLIQGVGTGIALPLMFNIVLEQAPLSHLGLMMGVASLITAIAPAVGPSFGGAVVSLLGWRWIFIVLLPVLVAAGAAGTITMRQVSETSRPHYDLVGHLLIACGFSCLVIATSSASSAGWTSALVLGLLGATALFLALYCLHARRVEQPLIRIRAFAVAPFTLSALAIMLFIFNVLGLGFLIPNFAQLTLGQSAFVAGALMLPGCAIGAVLAPLGGRLLDLFGPRIPLLVGGVLAATACICFAAFAHDLSLTMIAGFYFVFALGQGMSMGNLMTTGLRHLSQELSTDGNAIMNTMQQLCAALGTSVTSAIVASAQTSGGELAYTTALGTQQAFILLAALAAIEVACVAAALVLSRREQRSAA